MTLLCLWRAVGKTRLPGGANISRLRRETLYSAGFTATHWLLYNT
ncbi:MAG: hypothetical protein RMZ41_023425 [Nostoc sp. DedVER02]|nr:hypothetical protein [Nostoc sp. DedVER02]